MDTTENIVTRESCENFSLRVRVLLEVALERSSHGVISEEHCPVGSGLILGLGLHSNAVGKFVETLQGQGLSEWNRSGLGPLDPLLWRFLWPIHCRTSDWLFPGVLDKWLESALTTESDPVSS